MIRTRALVSFALCSSALLWPVASDAQEDSCAMVRSFGLERFRSADSLIAKCRQASSTPTSDTRSPTTRSIAAAVPAGDLRQRALEGYQTVTRTPRSIYVNDDRSEAEENPAPIIQRAAKATALIVDRRDLKRTANGYHLDIHPYLVQERSFPLQPLCEDQKFHNQMAGGFCTAFLISDTIIATAGHCVQFSDVDDRNAENNRLAVVFGYEMRGDKERTTFLADEVFDVLYVRERSGPVPGPDFAVLELTRPVPATTAQPFRLPGKAGRTVSEGTHLGLIGHPSGLPKKLSFNGSNVVLKSDAVQPDTAFSCQVNAFHGNSGSPLVFFDEPDVVAGILVKGQQDFIFDIEKSCYRTNVYAEKQLCSGQLCAEGATKATLLEKFLP